MNLPKLFDELTLRDLERYVADGQEEHLHLDFKTVRDPGMTSGDDKRNFACSVSGFANSAGGLIVWGVEARKNPAGVDCAVSLKQIPSPRTLLTRLNSLSGEATEPSVDGTLHRVVEADPDNGFVLTLVPESDRGPHMAKLGENRYYKRSGDSFYRMEHYDIADMFARRRQPVLEVFWRLTGLYEIHIGLRNVGRATARAPFFAFECNGPMTRSRWGLDGNGTEGLTWLRAANSGLQWTYGGGMDFALHPGMAHEVACLNLGIPKAHEPTEDLRLKYAVAAEDHPLGRGELTVSLEQLRGNA
jgi:Putative DNA-binding domain